MEEMEEMLFECDASIATLTVNRPAHRNAMTQAMYERLVELCDVVDQDDKIRVWILRGAGHKAFISGSDIRQFIGFQDRPDAGRDYMTNIDHIMGRLAGVQKPTIALIDGFAIGGGLLVALSCDLRVATPESKFCIPCVNLGNCLSMANYARLLELIGPARTLELVYTGRQVDAAEAHALGLLNTVVPQTEIEAHTLALAETIARSAPITIKVTKEAIRRLSGRSTPPEDDLIQACYASADFQEGVVSFLEKRKPHWQGH